MSESFIGRWSRRKQAAPEQVEAEDQRLAREQAQAAAAKAAVPAPEAQGSVQAAPAPELPSIESLTPQADFRPFMQPKVPVQLKNAALKKLFGDPHFNVMDGLDIYIDDYTQSEPIPEAMLRSLSQSRALKLFDYSAEEEQERLECEAAAAAKRAQAEAELVAAQPAAMIAGGADAGERRALSPTQAGDAAALAHQPAGGGSVSAEHLPSALAGEAEPEVDPNAQVDPQADPDTPGARR